MEDQESNNQPLYKLQAWFLRCFVTSSQRQRVVGLHTTLRSHKDALYWF